MKYSKEKNNKRSVKKTVAKILIFASILGVTATGIALSNGENNIVGDIKDKIFNFYDKKIAEKYPSLKAPQNVKFDLENNVVSWDRVDNATFYEVYLIDESGHEIYLEVDSEIDKDGMNYNGANYARTNKCAVNIVNFRETLYKLGYKDGDQLKFSVYGYNKAAEDLGKILLPGQSYVDRHQYKSPEGVLNYVVENQNDYFYNKINDHLDKNIRMILNSYLILNKKNDIFAEGYHKEINFLKDDYNRIKNLNYTIEVNEDEVRLVGTMDLYNEYFYNTQIGEYAWREEKKGLYRSTYFDFKIDDEKIVPIFKNIEENQDYFKNGVLVEELNKDLSSRWYLAERNNYLNPIHFTGENTFKYIDGLSVSYPENSNLNVRFNGVHFYEGKNKFVQEEAPVDCATGLINLYYPNVHIDKIFYLNNGNIRKENDMILFDVCAFLKTTEGQFVEVSFTIRSWEEDKSIQWHCNEVNETLKKDERSIRYRTINKTINRIKTETNSFLQNVQNYKNMMNTQEKINNVDYDLSK